ncbi:uncharacterized protein LOC110254193 [Exaiptasia diaphana]|uniref:Uncharacterized protein n=1 Tax=Exaiptasia diaphana TaxID=2652724 RepID=A0A913Y9E8_EXADI|nr:uncharacterized protein LOC110254193 [Exaiptasia diaphana]KXJ21408.1 hypothetical protein AC249_AIPGENE8879 [Exaiptasia diaphana]
MTRSKVYLLIISSLVLSVVSAIKHRKPKLLKNAKYNIGPISKTDIPTAEQILGKLLGITKPAADQQAYATSPQTLQYPPGSTPQARSPYKIFGSTGATPQTEDNPGPAGYPLPPPPPGYHYGRPRGRKHPPPDDEYTRDDGQEDEEEEEDQDDDDQQLPTLEPDESRIGGHRRGRGRCRHLGRNLNQRNCQGCKCICWKGIKPHIQWVRVPVCYRPCGVCCPKHEEQGACAAICHPCCHSCCHCCCHHPCCHCCHCCHCCRRSTTFRPPLAPPKVKKLKKKQKVKKTKIKKKSIKKNKRP